MTDRQCNSKKIEIGIKKKTDQPRCGIPGPKLSWRFILPQLNRENNNLQILRVF